MKLLVVVLSVFIMISQLYCHDTSRGETEELYAGVIERSIKVYCQLKIAELEASASEDQDHFESIIMWDYLSRHSRFYTGDCVKRLAAVDLSKAANHFKLAIEEFKKRDIGKSLKILNCSKISKLSYSDRQLRDIYYLKAVLHIIRLEINQADQCFVKTISFFPEDWELRLSHARMLANFEKNERVVELTKELLERDSTKLHKRRLLHLYISACEDVDTLLTSIEFYMKTIGDEAFWVEIAESFGGICPPSGSFYECSIFEEKKLCFNSVSCKIFGAFAQKNPERYLDRYADALIHLGDAYIYKYKLSSAIESLSQALRIHEELEKKKPVFNNSGARMALHYLESLQSYANFQPEALEARKIILEYYKRREKEQPGKFQARIAENLKYLGDIEMELLNYDESRDYYLQALHIYQTIADDERNFFRSEAAWVLRHLGGLFRASGNFKAANGYFTKSLEIYRDLAQKHPKLFKQRAKELKLEIKKLKNLKK